MTAQTRFFCTIINYIQGRTYAGFGLIAPVPDHFSNSITFCVFIHMLLVLGVQIIICTFVKLAQFINHLINLLQLVVILNIQFNCPIKTESVSWSLLQRHLAIVKRKEINIPGLNVVN